MNVVKRVGKALVFCLSLLLGAVLGAWLSLAALYALLEPIEHALDVFFILALAALLVGLLLVVRGLFGRAGLFPLAAVVVLSAMAVSLTLS